MPLAKCPDCGADVSSYAEACPNCGCPGWRISGKPPITLSVGSKYELGQWAGEPIVWRVLNIINGQALLITDKVIERLPYHNKDERIMWKDCYLREWLNNDFYDYAFSNTEKRDIVSVVNHNPDNPPAFAMRAYDGNNPNTEDRVFCLSTNEVSRYFQNADDCVAVPTRHAIKQGLYYYKRLFSNTIGGSHWWLRSAGFAYISACYVSDIGNTMNRGPHSNVSSDRIGVRPALWLKL